MQVVNYQPKLLNWHLFSEQLQLVFLTEIEDHNSMFQT